MYSSNLSELPNDIQTMISKEVTDPVSTAVHCWQTMFIYNCNSGYTMMFLLNAPACAAQWFKTIGDDEIFEP